MARTAATLRIKSNRLPEIERRLPGEASLLVSDSGDRIVVDAQRQVPVLTGALRSSIRKQMSPGALSCRVEAFGNRATGEAYALFVEMGTRHQAAQPYMRPAAEAEIPRIHREWRDLEDRIA